MDTLLPSHPAAVTSCRVALDTAPQSLGPLRDSSDVRQDHAALRRRMAEDGYLFLPGFLDRAAVLDARKEVVRRLAAGGALDPAHDPMAAVPVTGSGVGGEPEDLTRGNEPLHRLLYGSQMLGFYEELFGEAVRHYDFTWFRAVPPGGGTPPHCDVVYMGRGTRERLFTAWVPIGDLAPELGGLMILEGSHRQAGRLDAYLRRDVDVYCANRSDAPLIERGEKMWQDWDGSLTRNPASLREKLGGRWLTAEFRAGDLLTFGMATVHGSIDNRSDRLRLSSDSRYQPASEPADERWVGENPPGHGVAAKRGKIC